MYHFYYLSTFYLYIHSCMYFYERFLFVSRIGHILHVGNADYTRINYYYYHTCNIFFFKLLKMQRNILCCHKMNSLWDSLLGWLMVKVADKEGKSYALIKTLLGLGTGDLSYFVWEFESLRLCLRWISKTAECRNMKFA